MKRCPECGREYDNTMSFCLDDGAELLYGPAVSSLGEEPATAILHETAPHDEAATRAQIHMTEAEPTTSFGGHSARTGVSAHRSAKPLIAVLIVAVIALGGFLGYRYFSSVAGPASIDSIAVLPFQNVGGDPNFEYLSDGIAESLINSLTQIQQLKVVARNTAFRYKGKDVDAEQIGRELSVRAVLTGRVRQIGDKLNIQVDLVDTVTGAQLWGEEYDRPVADVLSIKQAIAREVTEKLRLRLSGEQQQQMIARETTDAEAYQFYLRGRFYWNRRSADGLKRAISEFQQAVERDPNYALGHVGVADCYLILEEYAGLQATETLPKAQASIERALQIDSSLAEAHASKGLLYVQQWRWSESEEAFKKAIELNPKYPTTRHWYSIYLRVQRRHADGLREAKLGQEVDPLSPNISNNTAMLYLLNGEVDSAIREWQKVIELEPGFAPAHSNVGLAYLKQQRNDEAIITSRRALELNPGSSLHLSVLGYLYAVTGKQAEALQIAKELEAKSAQGESIGQYTARVYAGLGDKDRAFAWLEKDFTNRSGLLQHITWWPFFDGIRTDPRYTDLVRRMNLTQ
jgi:TolB-like protein/Tfp pilus assembly protein PilF